MNNELASIEISNKIYTLCGQQVMLDEDLAQLYRVGIKVLNRATKRNIERFPPEFMFQLNEDELASLRCQIGTSNNEGLWPQNGTLGSNHLRSQIATTKNGRGGRRYLPYVFTEQGVAMLAGILRSDIAVRTSIRIINAFVAMRRFIASNAQVFQKVTEVERRQIAYEAQTDRKFEEVFNAIEDKGIKPEKGIFFDGQVFDAYTFVADIIRSAKDSIILIDNYVDDSVLTLLSKRNKDVTATIYTKEISKQLSLDLKKHNSQYPAIQIKELKTSHDRFMVIDGKEVYHFGASLKDLGRKWFAFSKFEKEALALVDRLG